jgi:tetratricopeptide (TPR) repeat protein
VIECHLPMSWYAAVHVRQRRWRWWIGGLGTAAVALLWWRYPQTRSCSQEAGDGNPQLAISLCRASYQQSRDDRDLLWLAKSYLKLDQRARATEVALSLLRGRWRGDAHGILSYCAMRDGFTAAAMVHAQMAIAHHTIANDSRGLVTDDVLLSQAAWQAGFTTALVAADRALKRLETVRDSHKEVLAYIARADALRRTGDLQGALVAARHAMERATTPHDRAWAHLKYAMCLFARGEESLALLELSAASAENRGNTPIVTRQIAMNEAYLLRWRDPAGALARLDKLTSVAGDRLEIWLLRGYLAADRGDFAEADRNFAQAEAAKEPDADWMWEVLLARAQLAERRGGALGAATAEHYYRRAVAMVALLRSNAQARSAYFVSSHRGPYDGLIALLARQGRWRDVLAVVLELDASDMLRATGEERLANDRLTVDMGPPEGSAKPHVITPATIDAVVAAWRGRDLVVVIAEAARLVAPGSERVYRLRILDGEVGGQDMGPASEVRNWAETLFARPGDREAARNLGRIIVPADASTRTLDVLAIGSLGKTPLAALRAEDNTLLTGTRPLARVLALRSTRAESRGDGAPVILADPRGDLPSAAAEGAMVAQVLGQKARVPGPSPRAQLWLAHDASLFHFAGHVDMRGRWRALQLADGAVDPVEILERGLAPRIAVLAACGSAAATDEEGWGSIAAALLEAGTSIVIATDRTVGDQASLALMRGFYEQPNWRADPARALAQVQQTMDRAAVTPDGRVDDQSSWAAFSVLARPPVVRE